MNRNEIVLAALAAGGEGAGFSPVHVQKVFFLIDREIKDLVEGPHFNFAPYDFGPFDRAVYDVLDDLAELGLVATRKTMKYREYFLTDEGLRVGTAELGKLPERTSYFIRELVEWVRDLTFRQLVSAIYNMYPEMKENSVFS